MSKCAIFLMLSVVALSSVPYGKHEQDYQEFVNVTLQGKVEHRLKDNTRVDILTDDLAIEIDFAKKWYEAIGQACHYSSLTGKRPAILLIVRESSDEKYVKAAKNVCRNTRVDLDGKTYAITLLVFRDLIK